LLPNISAVLSKSLDPVHSTFITTFPSHLSLYRLTESSNTILKAAIGEIIGSRKYKLSFYQVCHLFRVNDVLSMSLLLLASFKEDSAQRVHGSTSGLSAVRLGQ
jgi:hypothetical protein